MTDTEPTLGEVIRRLDAVSLQLTTLAAQMGQDRRDNAATFVPRELYNARHDGLIRRVDILEHENEDREKTAADTRRQLLFLVLGAVATAIVSLMATAAAIVGGGVR